MKHLIPAVAHVIANEFNLATSVASNISSVPLGKASVNITKYFAAAGLNVPKNALASTVNPINISTGSGTPTP